MQYNVVLEELHLDTNQIDDDGVAQLAGMLGVNKSIKKLNLAANRIGDVGMAALAEMLKCNSTLTELDLSSNEIGYDGMHVLTLTALSCPLMCIVAHSICLPNTPTSVVWHPPCMHFRRGLVIVQIQVRDDLLSRKF